MDGDALRSLLVSAFQHRRQVLVVGEPGGGNREAVMV